MSYRRACFTGGLVLLECILCNCMLVFKSKTYFLGAYCLYSRYYHLFYFRLEKKSREGAFFKESNSFKSVSLSLLMSSEVINIMSPFRLKETQKKVLL